MFSRTSLLAFLIAILVTLVCFKSCSVFAEHNGFDLSESLIPAEKILPGGPARDGIPSIDKPEFIAAKQAGGWHDDQQVLSLTLAGITRAYPINILNWHEIVNDNFGGQPVVISYCPLCGTGMAFSANMNGEALTFGVSGLLYNSDVLLYDRQSDSLWSQLKSQAVTGKFKGQKLTQLPLNQMTWKEWKARYPDGEVLSRNTGYSRDYSQSPYGSYDESPVLYFPVEFRSQAYHPKERVLGVEVDGKFKAYPFAELSKISNDELLDEFNGTQFKLRFNASARTGEVADAETGQAYPAVNSFWFAWYTFHPDTDVYKAQ
ncbi:DUF3179 domain-containing protein [Neptuniibacter sp. PT34_22]|uniref:DUF3179 domain-containing protein n=1 Tax=Neptuniibacter sp. PT34_22 TaxID=3398205 RepID=UPI0039F498FD